jgi:hypothetical protein
MPHARRIERIIQARPTLEGAGVRLKRVFGFREVLLFDPFLMLDDFHSSNPKDYMAGFPWHPHRGIETVTYMIEGTVNHGDSLGNSGSIRSGEVQWMTAGSGIIHQEMPQKQKGALWGLQLWVNLPRSHKMMKPRYRDIRADDIPAVRDSDKAVVKIVAGEFKGVRGPVKDIVMEPEYLDITLAADTVFTRSVPEGRMVFAYILEGRGIFDENGNQPVSAEHAVLFGDGSEVSIRSLDEPLRYIFISGKPLREPVAWQGPIVMNTQKELDIAFAAYRNGTFLKS